ncbi:MAG TPA: hypothetical protein VGD59_06390 [Acidisarcina sp.]
MPTPPNPSPPDPDLRREQQPEPASAIAPPTSLAIQLRLQTAGLLLLAAGLLVASIWSAGVHSVFPPGWWRIW